MPPAAWLGGGGGLISYESGINSIFMRSLRFSFNTFQFSIKSSMVLTPTFMVSTQALYVLQYENLWGTYHE